MIWCSNSAIYHRVVDVIGDAILMASCNMLWDLCSYLTGMRRVHDGFVNRFSKPSQTVVKRSHGIANFLTCIANSSQTARQSFKHVILFCATKIITKPSPSHRICREPKHLFQYTILSYQILTSLYVCRLAFLLNSALGYLTR